MCERDTWVPSEADNPYRDFRWWPTGVQPPNTRIQVDGQPAARPRLLGPDGRPVPRRVHGFGFSNSMVVEGG